MLGFKIFLSHRTGWVFIIHYEWQAKDNVAWANSWFFFSLRIKQTKLSIRISTIPLQNFLWLNQQTVPTKYSFPALSKRELHEAVCGRSQQRRWWTEMTVVTENLQLASSSLQSPKLFLKKKKGSQLLRELNKAIPRSPTPKACLWPARRFAKVHLWRSILWLSTDSPSTKS